MPSVFQAATPYPPKSGLIGPAYRLLFFVIAIVMSFAIVNLNKSVKLFEIVGKETLKIFLYQIFVTQLAKYLVEAKRLFGWPISLVASIITIVAIVLFSKLRVSEYIICPVNAAVEDVRRKRRRKVVE